MSAINSVTMETPVTVKVASEGSTRRFKLGLKDVGPSIFQDKLRELLGISDGQEVKFERFSDSAGRYVTLDPENAAVYKQLFRAAKAKLKLRIRATITSQIAGGSNVTAVNSLPPSYSSVHLGQSSNTEPMETPTPPTASLGSMQLENAVSKAVNQYCTGKEFVTHLRDTVREEVEKQSPKVSSSEESPDFANSAAPAKTVLQSPDSEFHQVSCNMCYAIIQGTHYHCYICDNGDYDICRNCFSSGTPAHDSSHPLNKRNIVHGKIHSEGSAYASRICNCCVSSFDENECVSCIDCKDYDLCLPCLRTGQHGHDARHEFTRAHRSMQMSPNDEALMRKGRNVKHAALCDGCDKSIFGIRHKCINCPDWDYCSDCIGSSRQTHPGHRFVSVLDNLSLLPNNAYGIFANVNMHYGVYCDGPICEKTGTDSCIQGVRYKCAICPDTDFCATCEASPLNKHNHTHPLIKLRIPIRNVLVTTTDDKDIVMGDVQGVSAESAKLKVVANTATQVQTIADVKPTEDCSEPVQNHLDIIQKEPAPVNEKSADCLFATFVGESIPDGTVLNVGKSFVQTWFMENTGTTSWPAGVTVKFVGGDYMFLKSEEDTLDVTVTETEVKPGELAGFSVGLTPTWPPNRTYSSYWRLTAPSGERFGDNIWCCIKVQDPEPVNCEDGPEEQDEPKEQEEPKEDEEPKQYLEPKEPVEPKEETKEETKEDDNHSETYSSESVADSDSMNGDKEGFESAAENLVKSQSSSEMVFPKLLVQSSIHSLGQLTSSSNKSGGIPVPNSPASSISHKTFALSEDGDGEEIEISSLDEFLTDEEYDILDASDEEFERVV